jgi:hypothetical protein
MLWASMAAAQTPVLNPRFLEFDASADHNATSQAGQALVTGYDLELYNIGAALPFQTNPLGKPTPNTSGIIRVDMTATFSGLPIGITYESRVAAVGPGGTGRSTVSNQFAFTNPCAVTLSPTGSSAGSAASTGSVGVTTGTGCAWTAVSNAAWVTISSGASGSGTGTVSYSIAANTAATSRTAALTIGGQTFNISQAAACTFTISPTSLSVTSGARTGTVSVTSQTGCAWTAASSVSWITVTSGASGSGNGSVGYSIAANTSITPRTGVVTIAGQAFTVTQDGVPCTSTISPAAVSIGAAATTGSIAVSIPGGCNWTATDNASWVSITSGASGTGNGTVGYSITANANTTQRTATITVAGQSFDITQAGVVCSTTISPTASSPTAAGGSGTVAVTANAGSCAWTATSSASWITITAGANGTGSGSVNYDVAPNTVTASRTGIITIAGQTMTVTQAAAPCNYAISPTVATLGPQVSTNTVAVTAANGCAWTATESASWITIDSGASGSGNGTVSYSVTANPTITPRSASMTIAGQSFDVTQAGQSCSFALTPAGTSAPAAGSTGTFAVAVLSGCTWTATSSAPWLTVTSGGSGSGNGTVGYSVAVNTITNSRTGTITVGGQAFTVTQAEAGAPCTFGVSPTTQTIGGAGGAGTVTITTAGGCAWTATTSTPWLTINGTGTGSGSGTVDYTVAANPDPVVRSGTIAVGGQIVTVSQAAATCTFELSPETVSVSGQASTGTFSVTANNGCAWTAASSAPWLTITSAATGSGSGTISYSVAANTTTTQRSASVTLGGRTFVVTQAAPGCTFTLSSTSLAVPASASNGSILVMSGTSCNWTSASGVPWTTVTGGASGSGNGTVSLAFAANTGGQRTGTLTIAGQTVNVTQLAAPCTTTISPTSISAPSTLTSGTVDVTSPTGCGWTAASTVSWIMITSGSTGTGSGTLSYTIAGNPATTARTGSLVVGGQTFNVSQSGGSCTIAFNPSSTSVAAAGAAESVDVTAGSGCSWTATASQSWIVISSGGSGTGPGTVNFTVAANSSTLTRTANISIGTSAFQITQAGTCAFTMSPLNVSLGAGTTTTSVFVFTQTGCSWTAASGSPWVTVTSAASGTGSGNVTLSVSANNTGGARTGTAAIAGQTFTIDQSACGYSVTPATVAIGGAGSASSALVSTSAGCSWSASSSVAWITMPNGSSGTGTAWLGFTVESNPTTTPRTGTLTIAGRTVTVTQGGGPCTFTVTPTDISVSKDGGTATVSVDTSYGCVWRVQNSLTWVTVTSANGGTESGPVTLPLQIAPNTLAFPRAGAINIAGKLVVINQSNVSGLTAPAGVRVVPDP